MLTLATLGLALYGAYGAMAGVIDLVGTGRLEPWANVAAIGLSAILLPAAAFVRVRIPGGIPLAAGALLGLQALALHDEAHRYGAVIPSWQLARAAFAALLLALSYLGSRTARKARKE